jgi:predicted butyrate kinase (DUF1464 family)
MPRVVGIDPGTVSIDICGLQDGQLFLDHSWPTEEVLRNPAALLHLLTVEGTPDLIAGPSGYGLPLRNAADASDEDLRLAFLAAPNEPGGLGGLRSFARLLGSSGLRVIYTPGVIHLDSVPPHRKLNRVDLGTADKLCVALLGIHESCVRQGCGPEQVSFILLELGGGFTAGIAVEKGRVVDGVGGSSGPIGWRAPGALDGEVAFLASNVSKALLFQGGVSSLTQQNPGARPIAIRAYVEGAAKAVRQLRCSAPSADEVLLSGRNSADPEIVQSLSAELSDLQLGTLTGFAAIAKQGAQGAALLADGLAGGRAQAVVDRLGIREAGGTVLDHLVFISPETARLRLGLPLHD